MKENRNEIKRMKFLVTLVDFGEGPMDMNVNLASVTHGARPKIHSRVNIGHKMPVKNRGERNRAPASTTLEDTKASTNHMISPHTCITKIINLPIKCNTSNLPCLLQKNKEGEVEVYGVCHL